MVPKPTWTVKKRRQDAMVTQAYQEGRMNAPVETIRTATAARARAGVFKMEMV